MLATVASALSAYIIGLITHEFTHVLYCRLLGAPVTGVSLGLNRVTVHYNPPSRRVDELVRAGPVVVFPLLAVVVVVWLVSAPSLTRALLAFAFLVGYLPRSRTDWQPVWRAVRGERI